jgi:hypothetical protein
MAPLTLLLIIAFPVCGLIGFYIKTKNQERIKLIEKGINPDEELNISDYRKQTNLKIGILLLALALGLFAGHTLVISFDTLDAFIIYLLMLLLFGGISFLINFLILRSWKMITNRTVKYCQHCFSICELLIILLI